jgi:hypothetical protein
LRAALPRDRVAAHQRLPNGSAGQGQT